MYVYVCVCNFFKVNDRSKLTACLQPGSQIKMIIINLQSSIMCNIR